MTLQRFPIRFTGLNRAMAIVGILPTWSYVDVGRDEIHIRLSWAFRATIDRSAIRSVEEDLDRVLGWGAHGWRGTWLVNGSSSGIVRITLDPVQRAWVMGVPVRLGVLRVSLEDPAAFEQTLVTHG